MPRVLLQLPVPKYLKKILEFKYGENYKAKENTLLGFTVINALQKKSDRNYSFQKQSSHESYFFITISVDKAQRKGFSFSQQKAYQLAKALHRNIREELYITAIINKAKYEIEYQTTLLEFLEMYDITDEELSYESLRKDFNRYVYKVKKNGTFKKISV